MAGQLQGTVKEMEEWVVHQWLGWSSHSLAYEFTPLAKPSQAAFEDQYPVECSPFFWILTSLPLIYHFDCQWIFVMWPQSLNFISFRQAWVPGESWRTGGKSSGKNVPRNPLHSLLESLLNSWPVLTDFIGLILGTEKSKDRRTHYQQIVPLGHTKE